MTLNDLIDELVTLRDDNPGSGEWEVVTFDPYTGNQARSQGPARVETLHDPIPGARVRTNRLGSRLRYESNPDQWDSGRPVVYLP